MDSNIKRVFVEMVASLEPTVRFWINARQLKDQNIWQAGWKSLESINLYTLEF